MICRRTLQVCEGRANCTCTHNERIHVPAYNATFSVYYFYHIYGAEVTGLMKQAAAGGKEGDKVAFEIYRGISYR